jgi:crossover junction endodeoxyribonuclease RuvC
MRFVRFNVWLWKWRDRDLDLVIYEKPIPFHSGQAASQLAFGLSSRVEEFCARFDIRCGCVQPNVLKKHATGHGNATKDAMVKLAQQVFGIQSADDNECDALWLLDYAKAKFLKSETIRRSA